MKKYILFIIGAFTIQSCTVSRNISEQYIKNNIQQHVTNEYSGIETSEVYFNEDFEFTAYKSADKQGLLIRGVKQYKTPKRVDSERIIIVESDFIVLNLAQIKDLTNAVITLTKSADAIKSADMYESKYIDYTVSKEFFISYKKEAFAINSMKDIHLWISGLKYTINSNDFYNILNESIEYIGK